MATQKVLVVDSTGLPAEVTPNLVSAGSADAGKLIALGAAGLLDLSMMPTGVGPDTSTILASETISAPALVNVYNNAGVVTVRNADKTGANRSKIANGFVLTSIASAASGLVYFSGLMTELSGLTTGTPMFLGAAGAPTATPTTTTGESLQPIGDAVSTTSIQFVRGAATIRG